jgi:heat shock protein 90kDa beta
VSLSVVLLCILGDVDEAEKENKQEFIVLCDWIKQQLGDKVAKVQVSKRLSSSPCVLVSGKFGWSANMERCTFCLFFLLFLI